jgi:hypothetical protein
MGIFWNVCNISFHCLRFKTYIKETAHKSSLHNNKNNNKEDLAFSSSSRKLVRYAYSGRICLGYCAAVKINQVDKVITTI